MKPLNLFKRKRNNDRVLKVEFFDEATACLAKSVQSIIGDPSANRDEMLARSFTQYLQHVGKLTGTRIPLQAVVDLHKIFGIAKNDWDLPGGGVDDPIGDTGGGGAQTTTMRLASTRRWTLMPIVIETRMSVAAMVIAPPPQMTTRTSRRE